MGPIRSRMTLTYPPRKDYISMLPPRQHHGGLDVPERFSQYFSGRDCILLQKVLKCNRNTILARYIFRISSIFNFSNLFFGIQMFFISLPSLTK